MNNAHSPPSSYVAAMPRTPTGRYGTLQAVEVWAAAEQDWRPLLETLPNGDLWRVAVVGDVEIELGWGTSGERRLTLDAPLVADLPGFVSVRARARTDQGAAARVTLTCSSGAGPQEMRRLMPAPAAFPVDAARFVAAENSTVTIRGVAYPVAALQAIPLVSGSVLTLGSGFVEFTP